MLRFLTFFILGIALQLNAMEWNFASGNRQGFTPINYSSFQFKKGTGFVGKGLKSAFFYTPELKISAEKFKILEIELTTPAPHVTVYFSRPGAPFAAARGVRQAYNPKQGKVVFNFAHNREWRDTINKIRIDAVNRPGQVVTIKKIVLKPLPGLTYDWNFATGNGYGFKPVNYRSFQFQKKVGFVGESAQSAFFFTPKLQLKAKKYNILILELDTPSPHVTLYFSRPGAPFAPARGVRKSFDARQKRVIFNFSHHPEWRDLITQVRIDAANRPGQKVRIKRVKFTSAQLLELEKKKLGLIPNSDFSSGLKHWSGTAQKNISGILLKPGAHLTSSAAEFPLGTTLIPDFAVKGHLKYTIELLDINGQLLTKEQLSNPTAPLTQIPPETAFFKLTVVNNSAQTATIARLTFHPKRLKAAAWQASWLWNDQARRDSSKFGVFRRDFTLPNSPEIELAILNITADDIVDCYLNGHQLKGPNASTWAMPDSFAVEKILRPGKNTLLCKVINASGPGGLLAELNIRYKSGRIITIATDKNWRCAASTANNWQNISASDVPLIIAPEGRGPWGKIPKRQLAAVDLDLQADNFLTTADAQTVWQPVFRLTPRQNAPALANQKLDFSMTLKSGTKQFLIAESQVDGTQFKSPHSLKLILPPIYFRYVPAGTYQVELKLDCARIVQDGKFQIHVTNNSTVGNLPQSKIVRSGNIPLLTLNGQKGESLNHYMVEMGRSVRDYREIREALRSVSGIWLHAVWSYDKQQRANFQAIENLCTSILVRNPEAHIVLTLILDTPNNINMRQFNRQHPEELTQNYDGRQKIYNYANTAEPSPSLASKIWLKAGSEVLQQLVQHLDETPYGARVAGLLPCAGITWEWMYWGTQREGEFVDYSKPFRRAFQDFAVKKYGTLAQINSSWGTNFNTLNAIVIPSKAQRLARSNEDLRLPQRDNYVIDFVNCLAEVTADAILHYCRDIKKFSQNRLLTGAYYGYINALTHGRLAQHSGHWALAKVLQSPAVDILMAPSKYSDRGPGEPGGFMIPEASVRLNHKIYVSESDIRTLHTKQNIGLCHNLVETRAVTEREMGSLWSCFGVMRYYYFSKSHFFNDPRLSRVSQQLRTAARRLQNLPAGIINPGSSIAVITNDNAASLTAYHSSINLNFVTRQYRSFPRSGAGFDCYIASDLVKIPQEHKMWYFLNPLKLSAEQLNYIKKHLLKPGKTLVFAYGVNVIEDRQISTTTLEQIFGEKFIQQNNNPECRARLTSSGVKFLGLNRALTYGCTEKFSPAFYPMGGTVLARTNSGKAALIYKNVHGCHLYFSTLPDLKPEILRAIAKRGGVPIYNAFDGDCTWAKGNLVAIHATEPGWRVIALPRSKGTALNLVNNQRFPLVNGKFKFFAPAMSTTIFFGQSK